MSVHTNQPQTFFDVGYSQIYNLRDLGVTTPYTLMRGSYTANTVLSVQYIYIMGTYRCNLQ